VIEFDRIKDKDGREIYPDGVYFGLPNDLYHADPALGSGGIRDLLSGGPTYWWNSVLNPNRKRKATRALDFGSACHTMVLEGAATFHAQYARTPDPDGALVTLKDMQTWLAERHEVKIPRVKADAAKQIRMIAEPGVRIYDEEIAEIEASGRTMLSDDDFARIVVASAVITKNPHLRTAFVGGFPEVSIFWTVNGVRFKARPDYLKPRAIGDLKTIGQTMGRPFVTACREAIARYNMPVQARHYLDGRAQIPALARAGRVFGEVPDAALWAKIVGTECVGWAWVFIQSVEAPLTFATSVQPQNPLIEEASMEVARAVETYVDFMSRFGANQMWLLAEPVTELDRSELPSWFNFRN
jgi:hypothetical protein